MLTFFRFLHMLQVLLFVTPAWLRPAAPPAAAAAAAAKSLQSCPTLCDPIDGSPPGSSIHGIFQARVLEWGAIAFSGSSPWEGDKYLSGLCPLLLTPSLDVAPMSSSCKVFLGTYSQFLYLIHFGPVPRFVLGTGVRDAMWKNSSGLVIQIFIPPLQQAILQLFIDTNYGSFKSVLTLPGIRVRS